MIPDNYIIELAKIESDKIKNEIINKAKGFRGGKFPLLAKGWYINLDHEGNIRELVYEKGGSVIHYNPPVQQ